jgi:hypothetical protein
VASATLIAPIAPLATPEDSSKSDSRHTYSCAGCGHVLGVSGLGRHRVYFELTDERLCDPVMNRVCPSCGDGLPGKNTP